LNIHVIFDPKGQSANNQSYINCQICLAVLFIGFHIVHRLMAI